MGEVSVVDRPRILIIDDEESFMQILMSRLEFYGYEVVCAYNAEEGIKKAKTHRPHVILLDVIMPVMDGWECCQKLKTDAVTQKTPIIVLTSYREEDLQERFEKSGANHLVQKPGDKGELMQYIKKIC